MSSTTASNTNNTRWVQLVLGVIAMMAISSPQYVWTLFVKSFQTTTGATLPAIQITFSLLIVLQTWLSPAQGWLIDRFGPKLLIAVGTLLSGLGWILSAYATSLTTLYATYGLFCGIGTGIVYIGIVGLMVRWFPDRRGFATGMVAAGYGFGAILTTFPIDAMLKTSTYQSTLITFGIILGVVGFLAALGLRNPKSGEIAAATASIKVAHSAVDYEPKQMLKTPIFWLMFVMMTMMSTGGLMVISQFANFTKDFGVANVMVWGLAALPLALTVDRITNGLTRPFFGWVSDRIGRENTMGLAFIFEGIAIALMVAFRDNALAFVLLSGVVSPMFAAALAVSSVLIGLGSGYATHVIEKKTGLLRDQLRFGGSRAGASVSTRSRSSGTARSAARARSFRSWSTPPPKEKNAPLAASGGIISAAPP